MSMVADQVILLFCYKYTTFNSIFKDLHEFIKIIGKKRRIIPTHLVGVLREIEELHISLTLPPGTKPEQQ